MNANTKQWRMISLNSMVRFRPTALTRQRNWFKKDADGYVTTELWHFAWAFGPELRMGSENPVEMVMEIEVGGMSAIRLRDVRKGQVFFRGNGPAITRFYATADATPTICGIWLCRCKVNDGIAKGKLMVFKDRGDAIVTADE